MEQHSTPRLTAFAPIFAVADLDRALAHYGQLGFTVRAYEGGGYGYADRGDVGLHLSEQPGYDPHAHASAAYLYVDDADELAAQWRRPGIGGRTIKPSDQPYGLREGAHLDLDHNLIRFGSPLPAQGPEAS
jgi:predicted enzyme related to lactoylglutathione lyase